MSIGIIFTTIMLGCVVFLVLGLAIFSFISQKMLDHYTKTKEEIDKELKDWQ